MQISIVVYWYPFCASPSLLNLAEDLASTDEISLFIDPRFATPLEKSIARWIVPNDSDREEERYSTTDIKAQTQFGDQRRSTGITVLLRNKALQLFPKLRCAIRSSAPYWADLIAFSRYLKRIPPRSVIVASDKYALLPILMAGRIPTIYYSLEATPFREESFAYTKILNIVERVYLRICKPLIISQSQTRAALLCNNKANVLVLPVTCARAPTERSPHLRKVLSIPGDKCILMLAGGLNSDVYAEEIANAARSWPDPYVLALHSNNGTYSENLQRLSRQFPGKVFLSPLLLTASQAEDIIYPSADIGIVLYRDLGFNYRNTAFSSGKLAAFLRAGIPLLLPDFPEYDELLGTHQLGLKSTVATLQENAEQISENYSLYSSEARKAYATTYHYDRYKGTVSRLLRSTKSVPCPPKKLS